MELTNKKVLPTKILLTKPPKAERKLASGLILPESADEVTSLGTALICGEGTESVPMPVKTGDKIMFPPRAVMRVKVDSEDYWLLDLRDVLLYWEGDI
jgi:chaperonin GroES